MPRGIDPTNPEDVKAELARWARLKSQADDIRRKALVAMGVQMAAWGIQDFRDKSEGRVAQGIKWPKITRAAAVSRLRARMPWKNDTAELKALRAAEALIVAEVRRMLPRNAAKTKGGKTLSKEARQRQRGAIIAAELKKRGDWRKIKRARKTVKARRKRMIDKEHAAAKIGVDTGRLVNSITYGVPELREIKVPALKAGAETPTRGLWILGTRSIEIGSRMPLAVWFDSRRTIFPASFIDSRRGAELRELATGVVRSAVERALA